MAKTPNDDENDFDVDGRPIIPVNPKKNKKTSSIVNPSAQSPESTPPSATASSPSASGAGNTPTSKPGFFASLWAGFKSFFGFGEKTPRFDDGYEPPKELSEYSKKEQTKALTAKHKRGIAQGGKLPPLPEFLADAGLGPAKFQNPGDLDRELQEMHQKAREEVFPRKISNLQKQNSELSNDNNSEEKKAAIEHEKVQSIIHAIRHPLSPRLQDVCLKAQMLNKEDNTLFKVCIDNLSTKGINAIYNRLNEEDKKVFADKMTTVYPASQWHPPSQPPALLPDNKVLPHSLFQTDNQITESNRLVSLAHSKNEKDFSILHTPEPKSIKNIENTPEKAPTFAWF